MAEQSIADQARALPLKEFVSREFMTAVMKSERWLDGGNSIGRFARSIGEYYREICQHEEIDFESARVGQCPHGVQQTEIRYEPYYEAENGESVHLGGETTRMFLVEFLQRFDLLNSVPVEEHSLSKPAQALVQRVKRRSH